MEIVLDAMGSDMQRGNRNLPLVAVWMVTYNHESFIAQALDSVIRQERDFKLLVFLNDDNSTDGTQKICRAYAEKFPDIIRFHANEKNLGPHRNALDAYLKCLQCGAKYVALLEGDDYWSDCAKLRKQVDFLEENENCSLVFHKVAKLSNGSEEKAKFPEIASIIDVGEFISRGSVMIHTSTILLRSTCLDFSDKYESSVVGDKYLILKLGSRGKFGYLPEYMSVYRIHDRGIWSPHQQDVEYRTAYVKGYIKLLRLFNTWCGGRYTRVTSRQIEREVYGHLKNSLNTPYFDELSKELGVYLSAWFKLKLWVKKVLL